MGWEGVNKTFRWTLDFHANFGEGGSEYRYSCEIPGLRRRDRRTSSLEGARISYLFGDEEYDSLEEALRAVKDADGKEANSPL